MPEKSDGNTIYNQSKKLLEEMNIKELKAKIREKRREERKLKRQLVEMRDGTGSKTAELLAQIRADIDALEAELDNREEQEEQEKTSPDDENRSNVTVINGQFRNGLPFAKIKSVEDISSELRSLGSYSMYDSSITSNRKPDGIESLALRTDERMVDRVDPKNKKHLDIGKYIRGMVTGDWSNAMEERAEFTTSATGVIIPEICSAEIIDLTRNISLFENAGVPVVPMTEGNLTIARVKNDPVFKFKPELEEQPEGNSFDLDSVQMKSKTCYGYAYVSLEAIHSAKNLEDIILRVFSQAMADAVDRYMLYGQTASNGTRVNFAPSGIMNDTDINNLTAVNKGYTDYIKAIGAIKKKNGIPSVLGINAETEEILNLMTDTTGQPLTVPKVVDDLKRIVSNQLVSDAENGSDALVFDPLSMIIGMQNSIILRMFQDTDYCIKHGAIGFQIYCMLDCAVIRPTHITKISGIGAGE
ncbi:MAG: phage major capsid protein [Ruminococcus sp.]|nr:phage major capsid protein [Ruminococcus sp.]